MACAWTDVEELTTEHGDTEEKFILRVLLERKQVEPIQGLENLSRFDARSVEQALIERYCMTNLYNQINSISQNNPIYETAIRRGQEILRIIGNGSR
jgi:hypothetical protein